ncbi:hypothetical protein [Dyadobacter sp. CY323]|uniref:hypothetical protein n=1 Tax=Dyadobacter sp. CY323 TaxID=2907302 RepID=UPI001F35133D|nr:hypothetical protein [Dyadobacter sp. CY323]MCE6990831.1 hypothetical protein [Dyadobacter sp. CY323]
MKYLAPLFLLTACWIFKDPEVECDPVSFEFLNSTWQFPSTVEKAVEKHNLDYHPPGFYYKINDLQTRLVLGLNFEGGDYYNERQPKQTLYSRTLNSYIFQFKEGPRTYDSLRFVIEKQFDKPFILVKGMKEGETLRENEKPFEYHFLTITPCLTVGIKRSKSEKREDLVTVRFMYNLSMGRMGVVMGNY